MKNDFHTFHIPVMGLGHSVDTPIRVAHFGISSVISIVDDFLLEKIRQYYCKRFNFPYVKIAHNEPDSRARRVTAYLDMVKKIVCIKMEQTRNLPFFEDNDKKKYFSLLPETSCLKKMYNKLCKMKKSHERDELEKELSQKMKSGSIDVNIMVKLDKTNYGSKGNALPDEFSDAKAALRGYAKSSLESSIVFSAGLNKSLFSYITNFKDFFRDDNGKIKKKIIIKVSDFRSSLIQGRFLARKGLEVHEYRIESGLNCGGHAFATNGFLLPCVMQEFKEKREQLSTSFQDSIQKYYKEKGWKYPELNKLPAPLITVQGGIGNFAEVCRLIEDFKMDMTGWASPFLLVPEATPVDTPTRKLLEKAKKENLFLSDVSPLGVSFNNIHDTGSEIWTQKKAQTETPGSLCPKQYLISNTEFTDKPICCASRQYQVKKLKQINNMPSDGYEKQRKKITEKSCLCDHLSNGALISLGIKKQENSPQLVCPGPNIQWFDRSYSLQEMVDHIYGRGQSIVPANRPHMFANELVMYVDYFEKQVKQCKWTDKEVKQLQTFQANLMTGIDFCLKIAKKPPYPEENLNSLKLCAQQQEKRLKSIYLGLQTKLKIKKNLIKI